MSATIDTETKLILNVALFGSRDTDPAAVFQHRLTEKHDLSEAEFLAGQSGDRTALARAGVSSRVNSIERTLIEK